MDKKQQIFSSTMCRYSLGGPGAGLNRPNRPSSSNASFTGRKLLPGFGAGSATGGGGIGARKVPSGGLG